MPSVLVSEIRQLRKSCGHHETAGHARTMRDDHIFQCRTDDIFAIGGWIGNAFRFPAFDFKRAIGILGKGEAANRVPCHPIFCREPPVVRIRELFDTVISTKWFVGSGRENIAVVVIKRISIRVKPAIPRRGLEGPAIHKHHVIVKSLQGGPHALTFTSPPISGFLWKQM